MQPDQSEIPPGAYQPIRMVGSSEGYGSVMPRGDNPIAMISDPRTAEQDYFWVCAMIRDRQMEQDLYKANLNVFGIIFCLVCLGVVLIGCFWSLAKQDLLNPSGASASV